MIEHDSQVFTSQPDEEGFRTRTTVCVCGARWTERIGPDWSVHIDKPHQYVQDDFSD